MSVLRGIGSAVPDGVLTQADAARVAATLTGATGRRADALSVLYERSGVVSRRTEFAADALYTPATADAKYGPTTGERVDRYVEQAAVLALAACRNAMDDAGITPDRVTHVVTVSCTGFAAPGVDVALVRTLGLPASVERTHVGFMGCHGAVNGLRVADALAHSRPNAVVLVCCVELCTLHFQYEPRNGAATANALFGDGAAACVVAADGDGPRLARFGAQLFADSTGEMGWRIGDHGFEMSLSSRVPGLIRAHVGAWVDAWLADAGMVAGDVGTWVIHPGGPRIIEAAADGLGLAGAARDQAVGDASTILAERGNMSSPTIVMMLERALARGAALPAVALAFGPGLAGEAVLIAGAD